MQKRKCYCFEEKLRNKDEDNIMCNLNIYDYLRFGGVEWSFDVSNILCTLKYAKC